jgi:hypothetical protein
MERLLGVTVKVVTVVSGLAELPPPPPHPGRLTTLARIRMPAR